MPKTNTEKYFSKPDTRACTDCGIALALLFLATGLYTQEQSFNLIAFVVLLIIAVWPVLLRPLAHVWFGISRIMGEVMSVVLLTLIFFIVLSPVAIVRRMMGKDRLFLKKFKKDRSSVFQERRHIFQSPDLKHPY